MTRRGNTRGFTLIELMLVVVIIGILVTVAIPSFMGYLNKSKTVEATLSLARIVEGATLYYHQNTARMQASLAPLTPSASIGGGKNNKNKNKNKNKGGNQGGGNQGGGNQGGGNEGGGNQGGGNEGGGSEGGGSEGGANQGPMTVEVNQFPPSSGYTPTITHTQVCDDTGGVFRVAAHGQDFAVQPWKALLFRPEDNFRYRYAWILGQQATPSTLAVGYAHALGDLDCNQVYSVWRMVLREDTTGGARSLRKSGPIMFQGRETD